MLVYLLYILIFLVETYFCRQMCANIERNKKKSKLPKIDIVYGYGTVVVHGKVDLTFL